jgi:urease accessory protein UreF
MKADDLSESIRRFAQRDWAAVADSDREYWAQRFAATGGMETFRIGQQLFEHARRLRPEWPTNQERADDLAHHVELVGKLARAAHAFRRR